MKIIDLLTKLRKNKIHVWIEDEKLKYRADNALGDEMFSLLKENKEALIKFLKDAKNSSSYLNEKIKKIDRTQSLPLTHGQKSMWFFDQFTKGNPVFNITNVVKIEGNLNILLFEDSINKVIQRHEILKSVFINQGGLPILSINENIKIKIEQVDYSLEEQRIKNLKLKKIFDTESRKPFNLSIGPLMRFVLIKMDDNIYYLCFTAHHIISDAWSNAIFVNELLKFYKDSIEKKETVITDLDIQYIDYSDWLSKWLETDLANEKINYWKKTLKSPVTLQLPTDYPRPKIQGYEGRFLPIKIDKDLSEKILNFCNNKGITLFVFLLTVFKTLLHKYTSQEDIMMGTVVANRGLSVLENMIGFFMNTLVLRSDFSGDVSFSEMLHRNKKMFYEALNNQEIPFDKILEELNVERDVSRTPLFQTMFILQNTQNAEFDIPGLKINQVEIDRGLSPFDLRLQLTETSNGIEGGFEYSTNLFKSETIKRMIVHFNNIIESVMSNPEIKILQIQMLSVEERIKINDQFNQTKTDFPENKTILDFFNEQVIKNPDNTAVIFEDEELSFSEINKKANQIAHQLINKNIGPEKIVGIMVERSPEMMIGILAILKAGGAYLPLDPNFPRERINYIINDSRIDNLLTVNKYNDIELPGKIEKILLDNNDTYEGSIENPSVGLKPENMAYIIYTSGSTGNPKGTIINHNSLINRLNWHNKKFPISQTDTILQKTPYTFDVSVWELLWWPMCGSKLCFLNPGYEKIPQEIFKAISKNNISVIHFVPSMMGSFLDYIKSRDSIEIKKLNSLKYVITSGEALTPKHVKDFYTIFKNNKVRLVNLYGPTEATIDVSYFDCLPDKDYKMIPIGKPIDNIQLYILDKNMQLQPIGVPGELCISGIGLARGYLNRDDLTMEKFIDHPFVAGEKLYKTGDLARFLSDGNIEFLGRIDFQVKIRGLRIELGEIENLILKLPNIKECVVTAWEKSPGDYHLVCYLVNNDEKDINHEKIKKYLETHLPDYMIPKLFQFLDVMPLSANGKIDRKALPAPVIKKNNSFILPANEYEKKIMNIWKNVLGINEIGVNDNFFEVGGHSLNLIKVNMEIQKAFNKEISLIDLFSYSTIKSQSQLINTGNITEQILVDNTRILKQKNAMNRNQRRKRVRR